MTGWLRPKPKQGVSTNIYEGMMTRDVTNPTYTVDEQGWTHALFPAARMRSGYGIVRGDLSTLQGFNAPPPKGMLDRTANGNAGAFIHTSKR